MSFPEDSDKLAGLSGDEPLPEDYGSDQIRLQAQSPSILHLYWRFSRHRLEDLRRDLGIDYKDYALVVKLFDLKSAKADLFGASRKGYQWFDARPGNSYRAEVGILAWGRGYTPLLFSNEASTPRWGAARAPDLTPGFNVSSLDFACMLNEVGYVSDALGIMLEGADAESQGAVTLEVAERFSRVPVPEMGNEELAEMRRLLVALALDVSYDDLLLILLSEQLRAWLTRTWLEHINEHEVDTVDAAWLRNILGSILGIEIIPIPLDPADEAAMRQTVSLGLGPSYVNMPRQPFYLWLPSMASRGRSRLAYTLR